MSSDLLREAAALMRERAEAVQADLDNPGIVNSTFPSARQWIGDATHIASWHPVVALAVAGWLDGVALFVEAKGDEEYFDLDGDPIAPEDTHAIGSALTVARAYLGRDA